MPVIPAKRRIKSNPIQTSGQNIRTGDFGGGSGIVAEAAGKALTSYGKALEAEKIKAEKIELDAFETKIRNIGIDEAHNDKTGFIAKSRGKDAGLTMKERLNGYDKRVNEEVANLGSETLRSEAALRASKLRLGMNQSYNVHASREMEKYNDTQYQSNLESITSDAILNYKQVSQDGSKIQESIKSINDQVDFYAERKGLDKKTTKNLKVNQSSAMHYGVVNQMLNDDNDIMARKYYESALKRKELNGETSAKLEKILDLSNAEGNARRAVDDIMASNVSYGDALKAARKIKDTKISDDAVRRVKIRYNEKEAIEKEAVHNSAMSAIDEVNRLGGSTDNLSKEQKLILGEKRLSAVRAIEDARSRGEKIITKQSRYIALKTMAALDPNKFKDTELIYDVGNLSEPDFQEMVNIQNDIKSGKNEKKEKLDGFLTQAQITAKVMGDLGIEDKDKIAKFTLMVNEDVARKQKETGKTLSSVDIRAIADNLAVEVDPDTFFGRNTRVFLLDDDTKINSINYKEIPRGFKKLLKRFYKSKGIEFSESRAEKDYKEYLTGELNDR